MDLKDEIQCCSELNIDWSLIDNKTILITGATGMVGSYLIRALLTRNFRRNLSTKIIAVGRSRKKFLTRFSDCKQIETVTFLQQDVQAPLEVSENIDYIFHMASNTHPRIYAQKPIDTIMSNVTGTCHLLELAAKNPGCRFVFLSSGDVYGDNIGGKKYLEEKDCGYLDCNMLRAGYTESKRVCEALCNAYREEKKVDFVTARLCRLYGPTMQLDDSRAISQFIMNAARKENIILKSAGTQIFSHCYVYDAVSALLYILVNGISGEVYNVAGGTNAYSLREIAEMLAQIGGCQVEAGCSTPEEKKGGGSFQNVLLSTEKLEGIGWRAEVAMKDGLRHTVDCVRKKEFL